ncbi:MAG TPA: permease prefix domain 1-containing protein, partial [Bryobacteraceae bacterium]|nr:permease prefix domain 1-containing protein [Bryobacteraceae bacterium]
MSLRNRWKRFRLRLRYLANGDERQRLLWEEMDFHIESMTEELLASGVPEDEARAAAHRKFGNMTRQSEDSRSIWITRWMNDLAQDLRQSFRGMRRDAGFTTFAILIAGLGIGASSTVFSVVNALLIRPLPFRDPARLVFITNQNDATSTQVEHYSDLRAMNHSFSDLAGFADYGVGDREFTG